MSSLKYFFNGPAHWTEQKFFPPLGDSDYPDYKIAYTEGLPYYLLSEREYLITRENGLIHDFIVTDPSRYPTQVIHMTDAYSVLEKFFRLHIGAVNSVYAWRYHEFNRETIALPVDVQVRNMNNATHRLKLRLAQKLREMADALEGEVNIATKKDSTKK
jgi:hypothetical protein